MNPLLLGPLVDLIGKISDKIWPDPAAKIAAQTELLKMQQAASWRFWKRSASRITRRPRSTRSKPPATTNSKLLAPGAGLGLCRGFSYQLLARPFLLGAGHDYPSLDMETLTALTFGMLGLGAMRTIERIKK